MSRKHTTARKTLGQVVICLGCCCGRVDKGHPEAPVDWLKEQWRKRALPKKIHLTISGCLGPCDASNVVLLLLGDSPVWLGGLDSLEQYEAIADWATECAARDSLLPLPDQLDALRMERFSSLAIPMEV
jgi:cobaltochelatase CobN